MPERSFASGLLQLEILEIEDAAKLQYVFGKDNLEKDQNQNQSIDHPSMKILKLINLPIIISICPQNYHIMWQLDEQLVMRCPKWRDRSYLYSETSQQGGEKATKQAELLSMLGGKDFGINTGDSIPRDLARSASRNDQVNTLVRSLHEEKGKLLVKIEEVEANTAEPSGYLKRELEEAKDLIEKVEKLGGKVEASKNSCSWACLKLMRQNNAGKRLARMTEVVKQISERLASKLHPLSFPLSHSETFISFESRQEEYEGLLMALKDDDIYMTGLCGMGGCGKTSLALEIIEVAKHLNLFD